MTSSLSRAPLTLDFHYSHWVAAWLTLLGAMLLSACWILPWPVWMAGAVSLLLFGWYARAMRRHALRKGPVRAVRCTCDGWQVAHDNSWQSASLRTATVWPPMVLLRLSSARGPVVCWLLPGRVAAQPLRRLRVLLRHGRFDAL